jgi:hypothetical protein
MAKPPIDPKAMGVVVVLLLVCIGVLTRLRQRSATDHDVSDPGVTL